MIIKATKKHLPEILELNNKLIINMKAQGFHHWTEQYPTEAIFRRDILRGSLYVYLLNEKVEAMVSFDKHYHETFDKIDWNENSKDFYFTHRLAVNPALQNQGIASQLMDFVEMNVSKQGGTSIRLGAFSGYDKVVRFYKKRGYEVMGSLVFDVSKKPFYGMEKML